MTIALALILHPDDGTVLIAQRLPDAHLPGLWEFPGGKCGPSEAPADCAVREAREETGLDVAVLEAWPTITHDYPDRTVTLHPFLCRAPHADARPLGSRRIAWVSPSDLARYPFPEANGPLIERLIRNPTHFTR